ncbi:MAG: M13 family metallopeptidase [Actinomycetes bacterium]
MTADLAGAPAHLPSGLDISTFCAEIRPQDDLYRHANQTLMERHPIPADRAVDGAFASLRDQSEQQLRDICAALADGDTTSDVGAQVAAIGTAQQRQQIGDLYASFLDEERVEALGIEPIRSDLSRVAAVEDVTAFVRLLGELQRQGVGGAFAYYVSTDAENSERYASHLYQGGLGLPDEAYYREEAFGPLREAYVAHVARMLGLVGVDGDEASAAAGQVLDLETRIAALHWDRVRNRDARATYNLLTREELVRQAPGIPWQTWLDGFGADATILDEVIVAQPSFFAALGDLLVDAELPAWRHWLTYHLVSAAAPYLSHDLVSANFDFYGRTLTGAQELRARWKRAVALVDGALGESVAQYYVALHFPPAAKSRMEQLVANLLEAYRESISALDWMGEDTRARALEKLSKFTPKIGYPDEWRDYSSLEIRRDDLVGNVKRSTAFEMNRMLDKLGKPVDKGEWFMTPPTVNAYYNPTANEIVFPAGILQPPFFDVAADDAVNYGAIGAVIGHEIGHGFDDQGSRYDGDGNLRDWWTEADRERFEEKTRALIAQYDALEPAETPGQHVNGSLTIGENIGDLGGLGIAYKAYRISLDGSEPPVIDGLTGWQRLFLGWAVAWRTSIRPEEAARRLQVDPHSPAEFRCNQVVRNLDEFYDAFDVQPADALWLSPEQRVQIW